MNEKLKLPLKSTTSTEERSWDSLCDEILKIDSSIRFAGICNETGQLLHYVYRKGINPLISQKEAEWSAFLSAFRNQTRIMFEHKLGKLLYSAATYQKVKRITVYLNKDYLLLVSMESYQDENYAMNKIFELPLFSKMKLLKTIKNPKDKINLHQLLDLGKHTAELAHEIRNPLAVIQNSLEALLRQYKLDENTKQYRLIKSSVYNIDQQINNILNFSKVIQLDKKHVPIQELIYQSLDGLVISEKIRLILPKNNPNIFCDKQKMISVFQNIITNANQAIDGRGTITISIKENRTNTKINFKNSGSKISKNILDNIFDPFFSTKPSGVGLGLVICNRIITAHEGKISVKNNPVTFSITLPRSEGI